MADDTIDLIAWKCLGTSAGSIRGIVKANPFLLDHPAHLPAGLTIEIPTITKVEAKAETINLWD